MNTHFIKMTIQIQIYVYKKSIHKNMMLYRSEKPTSEMKKATTSRYSRKVATTPPQARSRSAKQ